MKNGKCFLRRLICVSLIFNFQFLIFIASAQDTLCIDIDQCRQWALDYSQDIQRSANALKQAELTKKSMLTHFFPQVEGSAMVLAIEDQHLIDREFVHLDLLMRGAYMCGFSLQQPLFAGGKIVNGYKLTKVGVEVAKEQQRQQRAQILADVESAYWTYVAVLSKERLIDEYCRNLDTLLRQVEGSVDVGMATDYDLLQVKSAQSNLYYQRIHVQGGVTLCRLSLSRLVGIPADSVVLMPDTIIPDVTPPILNADFPNRPELRMLHYAVKAGDLMVKMKVADYLPTLGIGLSYVWMGNVTMKGGLVFPRIGPFPIVPPYEIPLIDKTFNFHTPILAVSLSVPITRWWQGGYEIRKAKLEAQNSRLEQEKNTALLSLEVQQVIQNIEAGNALINSSELALAAAEEMLRVAKNRYNANMTALSELLDAQAKLRQAESDCIEARTQYLIYLAEYRRVTGVVE